MSRSPNFEMLKKASKAQRDLVMEHYTTEVAKWILNVLNNSEGFLATRKIRNPNSQIPN